MLFHWILSSWWGEEDWCQSLSLLQYRNLYTAIIAHTVETCIIETGGGTCLQPLIATIQIWIFLYYLCWVMICFAGGEFTILVILYPFIIILSIILTTIISTTKCIGAVGRPIRPLITVIIILEQKQINHTSPQSNSILF